ncbi:hypothetical protein [Paenibacillus radicis (ex Gao et al. 2016)]|uniref:RCK N-terminal domain-containing protein n=1 Tax=Paenibacillus radicis (ex Gao et al. 2016) TaxID=1737354 RepID=A0A917HG63_9BACL|nr:hypothetical protein [Paenibacillus radicis (ex Gao et al. 2016)]GGG77561.1 hypothetical protein GCM10010918_37840 [Paenibacillus radicis (ex Gao et al. 2016)]
METIAVAGFNETSVNFIRQLLYRQLPFVVLTNSKLEARRVLEVADASVIKVVRVRTTGRTWTIPELPIATVYIFENSLPLSCRYLRYCRSQWAKAAICVITTNWHPKAIYKALGADQIIYTQGEEVSYLLTFAEQKPEL